MSDELPTDVIDIQDAVHKGDLKAGVFYTIAKSLRVTGNICEGASVAQRGTNENCSLQVDGSVDKNVWISITGTLEAQEVKDDQNIMVQNIICDSYWEDNAKFEGEVSESMEQGEAPLTEQELQFLKDARRVSWTSAAVRSGSEDKTPKR